MSATNSEPGEPEQLGKADCGLSQAIDPPDWATCYIGGDSALFWVQKISSDHITPAYILKRLAKSSDVDVRMAVADHKNTSLEVLTLLSEDESADVRYALAENHNINRGVLKRLSEDENPFVSHRALKTLARLASCAVVVKTRASIKIVLAS